VTWHFGIPDKRKYLKQVTIHSLHSRGEKKKKKGSAKRATQTEAERRKIPVDKDLKRSLVGSYDRVGVSGFISSRDLSIVLYQ
jgi:hypothetical protein